MPLGPIVSLVVLGLFFLQIVFFIVIGIQARQIRRLRRRYEVGMALAGKQADGDGIDRWLSQQRRLENDVAELRENLARTQAALAALEQELKGQVGRVGVVRYNAFRDTGHDLSFSVAWLNQRQDGVVLTSIYSRGESNVYAKPIFGGQSPYPLSEEEIMAIQKAMDENSTRSEQKKQRPTRR